MLEENIIPFWTDRKVDEEHGGFLLNHDASGKWMGESPKFLVAQSRMLWFHSRLLREGYGGNHAQAASAGYSFLRDRLWNADANRFNWAVDHSGTRVHRADPRLYGHAFALFAVSEYARASGDEGASSFASGIFELLESDFHDKAHGGYFTKLPLGANASELHEHTAKLQNDHLHVLEAFLTYGRLKPSELLRSRTWEVLLVLSRTVSRSNHASSSEWHSSSWREHAGDREVSFGHDIEANWLMLEAADLLEVSPSLLLPHVSATFDTLRRKGISRDGSIWYKGSVGGRTSDRRRIWWVQAEVLVGVLDLYCRSGEIEAAIAYLQLLHWIETEQADWRTGEWHETITGTGARTGGKASEWKCPYHTTRSMLECLRRVDSLRDESVAHGSAGM